MSVILKYQPKCLNFSLLCYSLGGRIHLWWFFGVLMNSCKHEQQVKPLLVGCLQFFLWITSALRGWCSKKITVCLKCLAVFVANSFLLVGKCHSPLAGSLRIAWRTEEQLLCGRGLWKGQKSWQHFLYHILRPTLWIQWKKAARQVGGAEGEFYILPFCSSRAGTTNHKDTQRYRLTTSSENNCTSANLLFTLEGWSKIVLFHGKGILLIVEALSFSHLSIIVTALLAKQCPYGNSCMVPPGLAGASRCFRRILLSIHSAVSLLGLCISNAGSQGASWFGYSKPPGCPIVKNLITFVFLSI